ncbi:MAG TPA: hypothetical protein VFA70_06320 [Dehalococcoidia bacterium]|nr:hypothetical protein [Dehalococcoidia bacterium]
MPLPSVHLEFASPLPAAQPLFGYDVDADVAKLAFSTGPGGWNGLTLELRDTVRGRLDWLPNLDRYGFLHLGCYLNGVLAWEGRVQKLTTVGGEPRTLAAVGYGVAALTDGIYQPTGPLTSTATAGTILRAALAQAAPLISVAPGPDEFVDSGVLHAYSEVVNLSPGQIVSKLQQEGGSGLSSQVSVPYDFLVYARRQATWRPRQAPPRWTDPGRTLPGADYWIDLEPEDVLIDADWTDSVSSVTVVYTPTDGSSATSTTVTAPAFVDRYGFSRSVCFANAGAQSASGAQQLALTYLSLHNKPLLSLTVQRKGGRGLRIGGGAGECPPEQVRAGQWLQVGSEQPAFILSTQYDCLTGDFQCTATNYARSYWTTVALLQRGIAQVANGQNPVTAAPQTAVISSTSTTHAPASGGADALPSTPLGYVGVLVNGAPQKIAYY